MSALADITINIRAEVQHGAGRVQHVGRQVTAKADEKAEEVRNTITMALRQINDEVKELIR
jgi:ElaB/YqjD/DUF883 family membrane-anchored ribosome-binding protein